MERGDYKQRRGDNINPKIRCKKDARFALLAWKEFYYFGEKAITIPPNFRSIQKKGPGYKANFEPQQFVGDFLDWLKSKHKPGKDGDPWGQEYKSSRESREREACKSSC